MKILLGLMLLLSLTFAVSAQAGNKKNTRPVDKSNSSGGVPQAAVTPSATPEKLPQKKNSRDETNVVAKSSNADAKISESKMQYRYEFSQPDFLIKKMIIEHDENGLAKISFQEKNFDEDVTETAQISAVSLEKIKKLFETLNFLDSTDNYQSTVRNYPHLGTKKIFFKDGEKERNVVFNWSENADAKALADEYARIGYELVWKSDIKVARENQPLQTPGLVDVLDSYLRRGEISDPSQMLPFLKELSTDERLPLIARNHLLRLIKDIEKAKK